MKESPTYITSAYDSELEDENNNPLKIIIFSLNGNIYYSHEDTHCIRTLKLRKSNPIYEHINGNKYYYIYEVINYETKEIAVLYQDLNDNEKLWVRLKENFFGNKIVKDQKVKRFTKKETI